MRSVRGHPLLFNHERNIYGEAIRNFLRFGGRRQIKDRVKGGSARGRPREVQRRLVRIGQRYGQHYSIG